MQYLKVRDIRPISQLWWSLLLQYVEAHIFILETLEIACWIHEQIHHGSNTASTNLIHGPNIQITNQQWCDEGDDDANIECCKGNSPRVCSSDLWFGHCSESLLNASNWKPLFDKLLVMLEYNSFSIKLTSWLKVQWCGLSRWSSTTDAQGSMSYMLMFWSRGCMNGFSYTCLQKIKISFNKSFPRYLWTQDNQKNTYLINYRKTTFIDSGWITAKFWVIYIFLINRLHRELQSFVKTNDVSSYIQTSQQ